MNNEVFENFKNNTELYELYNELIKRLDILPKLTIKKRNSYLKAIIFCNGKNFGCISLWDDNSKIMDEGFRIAFQSNKEIKDNRVKTVPEHNPNDFVYYAIIKNKSDIDKKLIDWLKQSYENAK